MTRTQFRMVGFLTAVGLLLTACAPPVVETVEVPGPTQVVTVTPTATVPPGPTTLVICQDAQPETLYLYGGSPAARHVLEAIYDGPIDQRTYSFQPVILEKLPSLEDGDAYFDTTTVQEGDQVVDVTGQPVELTTGVQVFPSHTCLDVADPECVVTFDGTPIEMEQMFVSWQLLDGVAWSDGEAVTADDSVYSYELACDPDTPATASIKDICEYTASYTAAGAVTTVWAGLPGYADDLYVRNFFSPLPRHLWKEQLNYSATDLLSRSESAQQPMGWGPFLITEWVQGERVTLERNPAYFRADEGLPRVDQLVFRFAEDAHELIAMVLAAQCDVGLIDRGQLGWLGGELGEMMPLLVAAQEQELLNVVVSPSEIWEHLEFGINSVSGYNRPDFFEDAQVRQAIAHCIDRQALVDEVTFGLGQVAESYIPPEHPLYAGAQLIRWEYDVQAGQGLLAEAGWIDDDGDGVLEARGVPGVRAGTQFHVELLTVSGDEQRETIARIIRSNLADCGIRVDVTVTPLSEFLADGPEGPLMGRQFDLALFHWFNEMEPPCDLYLTEQIPDREGWGGSNVSGFSDDAYDQACRAALSALPGTFEYERYHTEAQEVFSQQLPDLPLFWWVRVAIVRPGVESLWLDPSEESEMWGVEEITLRR